MKYKDYYQALGLERTASADDIKKAYRKLAHQYHPDISKEAKAEEKFKEIAEAYQTLKDPEKRAAYDQLGQPQPGQDFHPQADWQRQYANQSGSFSFDDMDLEDLFASFQGGRYQSQAGVGRKRAVKGQDYEVTVHLSVEEAYTGTQVKLDLTMQEYDEQHRLRRVPRSITARIPKGVTDGHRLCLKNQGGKGAGGGANGDLYLTIALHPHSFFRVKGHDIHVDVPLAPWEAVLGTQIELPTPAGKISLKIPAGTQAGQKLRLAKRGLPLPKGENGDLYANIQIVVPTVMNEEEQILFKKLADLSNFNPRGHFG
ncbi:MAG: DnaJ C-terminal domain-containing protein [Pseudomonadota bacterium]